MCQLSLLLIFLYIFPSFKGFLILISFVQNLTFQSIASIVSYKKKLSSIEASICQLIKILVEQGQIYL